MSRSSLPLRLLSAVLFATLLALSPHAAQTPRDATSADARLRALFTDEWAWRQKELAQSGAPPGGPSDRFPKVDAAAQQARLAYWTRALATLDGIPFDQLSPEEKVNAQVFRTSIRALANDVRFRTYEAPFNSDTFFWTEFTPRQGFSSAAAYRAYLGRLRDVPRYFDEQIANMRTGLARGFTVPRVSVAGRDKTIEPYVKGDVSNPLYTPFSQMPATIPANDQAALRAGAVAVIRDTVAPAYVKLLAMMRDEYLPRARTTLAASTMPDGDAFYQAMIEKFTTLTLTARQIHDLGLKEVARIQAEMEAVKQQAAFKGTMAEFFTFLRTDPQFYAKTPRELLSYSAYVSKKADWKLAETIGFLPRRRHGIRPVPDALAPIYTGGRGGLESCLMNTYNLAARPLYTLAALTLHECTPGHSFQAALALEGPERPAFRRATSFSGYGEGWGLYTEWLGTVMGIYETPYEDFGRLTYEMWRASRLVIDTGIHQFGWTREQAMEYLRTRAALRGAVRARDYDGGRALHRVAGPGARVQAGRNPNPPPSPGSRGEAGREIRPASVPRRHPGDRLRAVASTRRAHGRVHPGRRGQAVKAADGICSLRAARRFSRYRRLLRPCGFRRLQEELARLWKVERPPVVATVTWAAHLRYLDINLMHALIPGISVAYS